MIVDRGPNFGSDFSEAWAATIASNAAAGLTFSSTGCGRLIELCEINE